MVYTSIYNEKIKEIKKLQQKKYRDKTGTFFIESEHLVMEAYQKGVLKTLIVCEDSDFRLDVDTIVVSKSVLNYLSEMESCKSVMGIVVKKDGRITGDRILALDFIQDPGNLGTIIRSALAFRVDTILVGEDSVDVFNSKVVRASQGMIFDSNIVVCNLREILPDLKRKGYDIIVTKVNGGKSVRDFSCLKPYVLIMGNEGSGVSSDILELGNQFLTIPMNSKVESLNVAVATSIILFFLDK